MENNERQEPQTWLGRWAKHLIENEGVELEEDIDEECEDCPEYDFGVYEDD
jgi:hypothetical protein|tara:strand:- start:201 stop:353 length:153 start_codon:yes stop_codon:yes gene_type:complete